MSDFMVRCAIERENADQDGRFLLACFALAGALMFFALIGE